MLGLDVKADDEELEKVSTITKGKTNIVNGDTYIDGEIETDIGNEAAESSFEKRGARYYTYLFVKRTFDIIGSIVGIAVLIPVTLVVGVARIILKEKDGPLFYKQLRVGKNGKAFRMYKFRTMCIDADEKLKIYLWC